MLIVKQSIKVQSIMNLLFLTDNAKQRLDEGLGCREKEIKGIENQSLA